MFSRILTETQGGLKSSLYVITDIGTQFESEFFAKLSAMVDFHRLRISSHQSQTNRNVEGLHRILKASLKARGGDLLLSLRFLFSN